MSASQQPQTSGRGWWPWVAGMAAALLLAWFLWPREEPGPKVDPGSGPVADQAETPGAEGAVARVSGVVFVERLRPRPEPVVEVVLDSAGGVEAGWASGGPAGNEGASPEVRDGSDGTAPDVAADPSAGETEAGAGPEDAAEPEVDVANLRGPLPGAPEVDLEPPPAGTCRVLAWQSGTQVSDPVTCDDEGTFEVALHPGRHGRTAFEVLVSGHLRAVIEVEVPPGGTGRLPPVALGVAETVQGQVVDSSGQPLTGIEIQARPQPDLDEPEPWRSTTDAQGQFVFDTLPPGPVTLRAEAEGFAPSVVETLAPQPDVLITLQTLVDIRGRVVGPTEALARAVVRIEGSGVWPARAHTVSADGGFTLPQIPEGIYALEAIVEATPADPTELASIPLENVTPDLAVTLALAPAFRVPVQVVDPSGTPVEGARVVLSNSSIGLLPRIVTTDAEGRAAAGPVVVGPYVVRAEADGFLPAPAVAVTVEGPDTPTQVLTLAQPARIEGVVVDDEGNPVADARVELEAEHLFSAGQTQTRARFAEVALRSGGSLGVTVGPVPKVPHDTEALTAVTGTSRMTDRDGRFAFEMLTPGNYSIEASHGRFARSERVAVRLTGAHSKSARLVLRQGHALTGRVRDGNDRPVENATIRIGDGTRAWTDRKGLFDAGLRRGVVRLVVSAPGLASRALSVRVDDRPVDVEVSLGRARAELTGRIEGGNGEALADARVTVRALDGLTPTQIAWTDARGIYRFEDLPPGELEIEVDHPEHGPATRRVMLEREDSTATTDVGLVRGWSIEVEVRAAGTREPIAGAVVQGGGHRQRTDGSGVATLDRLTEPRVRVQIEAEDYAGTSRWVDRDGDERQSIRVELGQGGGVSGRVIDYRGDPVAAVDVVVRNAEGTVVGRARTDGRGRWSVPGVEPGDIEVAADPPPMREEELASAALSTDVLRGHVTRDVVLRFDRR